MAVVSQQTQSNFAAVHIVIPNDNELISQFLNNEDQTSFEELVRRHAPMIMSVCRNMLLNQQDAEDAFQATFLVFSRKMKRLLGRGSVGGWLYHTAIRNCLQTRRLKGRKRETAMTEDLTSHADEPWLSISNAQESDLIHSEINRLPERYRDVIVLCHLEGFSRGQAAEFLNCTESSVKAALARARNLLRNRLVKRGLVVSSLLATLSANSVHASQVIPESLIDSTIRFCTSASSPSSLPPTVAQLAQTGTQTVTLASTLKISCYVLVAGIIVSLPLVNAAQTLLDQEAEVITVATDELDSSNEQEIQLAEQTDEVELTPEGTTDNELAVRNDLRKDTKFPTDSASREDFDPENSSTYWELKTKSLRSRAEYFNRLMAATKGPERLKMEADFFETMAEVHVAELNIARLKNKQAREAAVLEHANEPIEQSQTSEAPERLPKAQPGSTIPAGMKVFISKMSADEKKFDLKAGQAVEIWDANEPSLTAPLSAYAVVHWVDEFDHIGLLVRQADADRLKGKAPEDVQLKIAELEQTNPLSNRTSNSDTSTTPPPGLQTELTPGEVLLIEHPDGTFNRRCVIAADHTIRMPFAGVLDLKGKNILGAQKLIQQELANWFKDSELIFVSRENASNPFKQANVK